jgi:hypothetical protein
MMKFFPLQHLELTYSLLSTLTALKALCVAIVVIQHHRKYSHASHKNMHPIANWKPMKKIEQEPIAFLSG